MIRAEENKLNGEREKKRETKKMIGKDVDTIPELSDSQKHKNLQIFFLV